MFSGKVTVDAKYWISISFLLSNSFNNNWGVSGPPPTPAPCIYFCFFVIVDIVMDLENMFL